MFRLSLPRSVLLLMLLMTVILLAPLAAPEDVRGPENFNATSRQPPSLKHLMGTNAADVDLFSLVLKGSQTSLIIAIGAVAISLAVGTMFGMFAAFSGRRLDATLMRAVDVALAIPRFLVLLAVLSFSTAGFSNARLILLLGLTGWFGMSRITRNEVTSLLGRDWVIAAQASGVSTVRIAVRHIFPHLLPMLMVTVSLSIGHTIVLEAALMYLGAGSGGASLGNLLYQGAGILSTKWWLTVFPGLAILLIVFACNSLGEGLRDVFAPEQVHAWPTT